MGMTCSGKGAALLALLVGLAVNGWPQALDGPTESTWRSMVMGLPEQPPANISADDVTRFQQSVMYAAPYFATLKPGDWEANRELARRMATYMMALGGMNRGPQFGRAVGRAGRAMGAMRMVAPGFLSGYPMTFGPEPGPPMAPGPPPAEMQPGQGQPPPFPLEPPAPREVAGADREVATDLTIRYRTSAGHAANAWKNAEDLRMRLEADGMTVNDDIAASVARLRMDLILAAEALGVHDWAEAQANLERADYETRRLEKSVGG